MKINRTGWLGTGLAVVALAIAGCGGAKEPATKAIAGIETAIESASAEAAKYVPEDLATVQGKLAELKTAYDGGDYAKVLASAPGILDAANKLKVNALMKKQQVLTAMQGEWKSLSESLPAAVTQIDARLGAIDKMRRRWTPEQTAQHDAARTGVAEAKALWEQAGAAMTAGNLEEAVTKARDVKAKTDAAMAALGLTAAS